MLRTFKKVSWTDKELKILERHWNSGVPIKMWADQLPRHTERAIDCKGRKLFGVRADAHFTEESITWKRIQQVLADGQPRSARQIAAVTGLNKDNIFRTLKAKYPEECHIGGYGKRTNGGGVYPILWLCGPGEDEPMKKGLTKQQAAKKRWEERKRIKRDEAASWI